MQNASKWGHPDQRFLYNMICRHWTWEAPDRHDNGPGNWPYIFSPQCSRFESKVIISAIKCIEPYGKDFAEAAAAINAHSGTYGQKKTSHDCLFISLLLKARGTWSYSKHLEMLKLTVA